MHAGRRESSLTTVFNVTNLLPGRYEIGIILNRDLEDRLEFSRSFEIHPDPFSCSVFLTGKEGVSFSDDGQLSIDFGITGVLNSYSCFTNDVPTPCKSLYYITMAIYKYTFF